MPKTTMSSPKDRRENMPSKSAYQTKEETQNEALFFWQEVLKTREVRETLGVIVPELCNVWAGKSVVKKRIARPLGKVLSGGFTPKEVEETVSFFETDTFASRMESLLPSIVDGFFKVIHTSLTAMESLDPDQREAFLKYITSEKTGKNTGESLNRLFMLVNDIYKTNPDILLTGLMPVIRAWYENTDFGELRECADLSATASKAFITTLCDLIWEYPAKLVMVLSVVPDLTNAVVLFVKETLVRFNQISPDLASDIVLSLMKQVDGNTLATCVNEGAELIRKLHTGSALIGSVGTTEFSKIIEEVIIEASSHIDGEIVAKATVAIAENKAAILKALSESYALKPELWAGITGGYATTKNAKFNARKHHLTIVEEFSDDLLMSAVEKGYSDIETDTAAEIVNLSLQLFNRIQETNPKLLRSLVARFCDEIDTYELKQGADAILPVLGNVFQPVGRAILPGVIKEVCQWMAPQNDEYEAEMTKAREMLAGLFVRETEKQEEYII